ncbi:MAG: dolichol kinase [Nitrososphaerota archaeon]
MTRIIYSHFLSRGFPQRVAVYYNRKILHMLTGGLIAVLVPYIFQGPLLLILMVAILAIGNYLPHRMNKLFYWYQVEDNMYEVHFIIMWGVVMTIGFMIGNIWLAVLPTIFMSFGDGITGIVRNSIYKRRTKSWWGNIAMMIICAPVGYAVIGIPGLISGVAASLIEKFEYKWLDDNITVPLVSFLILLVFSRFNIL